MGNLHICCSKIIENKRFKIIPVSVSQTVDKIDISLPVHDAHVTGVEGVLSLAEQVTNDLFLTGFFAVRIARVVLLRRAGDLADDETWLADVALHAQTILVSDYVHLVVDADYIGWQKWKRRVAIYDWDKTTCAVFSLSVDCV